MNPSNAGWSKQVIPLKKWYWKPTDAAAVSKHKVPGKKRGPKSTISIRDQVLMLLMYYREYRTFFHAASSYGISESQCWKIITGLEQGTYRESIIPFAGERKN